MRKFLLTLPNGNEKCVLAKNPKTFLRNFFSHYPLEVRSRFGRKLLKVSSLPTGREKCVWPLTLEIFFPLLLFGDGRYVLTNFREKFFLPSVQAEKFNPRIFPLERNLEFERFPAKKFHSSAYKRKIHPNRTPFRSKMSRSFSSSHLLPRNSTPTW